MDESIWPESIKDEKAVSEYRMVRYDPWDAQYLGYLVMDLKDADYDAMTWRPEKWIFWTDPGRKRRSAVM